MEKEWEMNVLGEDTEFRHTSVIKYPKSTLNSSFTIKRCPNYKISLNGRKN